MIKEINDNKVNSYILSKEELKQKTEILDEETSHKEYNFRYGFPNPEVESAKQQIKEELGFWALIQMRISPGAATERAQKEIDVLINELKTKYKMNADNIYKDIVSFIPEINYTSIKINKPEITRLK